MALITMALITGASRTDQINPVTVPGGVAGGPATTGDDTIYGLDGSDRLAGGGDVLDVASWLPSSGGYAGGSPFGAGHLRLLQHGADALLSFDNIGGGDVTCQRSGC